MASHVDEPEPLLGYPAARLARALTTAQTHADRDTRKRAEQRAARWTTALENILEGKVSVGDRAPVARAPAWVTLEVLTGGFASGNLLAGGPLQEHERAALLRLRREPSERQRGVLNAYYLTEPGMEELRAWLRSGAYRVRVPEEGALLTLCWLLDAGEHERAAALLEALLPFFSRLRFYPVPAPSALGARATVHRCTVSEVCASLSQLREQRQVARMNATLRVWNPLYDRLVSLWLETVEGPAPTLLRDAQGDLLRTEREGVEVRGGEPLRREPEGWHERARAWLEDYRVAAKEGSLPGRVRRPKENFARLRAWLEAALARHGRALTERERLSLLGDRKALRQVLATVVARRGVPGAQEHRALRERQARDASRPTNGELRAVLLERLRALPQEEGAEQLEPLLAPASAEEAARFGVPADTAVPESFRAKVERCLEAPVEALVARGVLPSGEELARVVPQLSAQVHSAGIEDPALARLDGAVYAAFRRRRSLLLLNYQRQVQLGELPWVSALDPWRRADAQDTAKARHTLEQLALLELTAFPQAVVPNKLLQELRSLAKDACLELPLCEELAADIFMGSFSGTFVRAAKVAAELLRGTLYERYYGLDYDAVLALPDPGTARGDKSLARFATLCRELAVASGAQLGAWSVAANGAVLEQQQVLTTQNLAVLVQGLGLRDALAPRLEELARRSLEHALALLQAPTPKRHALLLARKDAAYAWRQGLFFLSLGDAQSVERFWFWAQDRARALPQPFAARFEPAWRGLLRVLEGGDLPRDGGAEPLLGWSTGRHWLDG